jgi:predicted nucleic acid-binding protein
MKRYLLDTTPLAAGLFNRPAAVDLLRPWLERHEAATSIVVYGEVVEYLKEFPDFAQRHAQFRQFLRAVTPYFLTYAIMVRYAELRRRLRHSVAGSSAMWTRSLPRRPSSGA